LHAPVRILDVRPFPTRRSSDLGCRSRVGAARAAGAGDRDAADGGVRAPPSGERLSPVAAGRADAVLCALRLRGVSTTLLRVLAEDRKSTRLNSSHLGISYAVFC